MAMSLPAMLLQRKLQRTAAVILVASPVLIQVPYSFLIANFDYPDVLRLPAGVVLDRFARGAADGWLTLWWFGFALAIVPLLVAMSILPAALRPVDHAGWIRMGTPLGIISGVLQVAGLMRWVVLVPLLATAWVGASGQDSLRASIELVFVAQHQLFGVLLGEYLGQLLLGFWTLAMAVGVPPVSALVRTQRWVGVAAGSLFMVGSFGALMAAIPALSFLEPIATLAFLVWSIWCVIFGVVLWRLPMPGETATADVRRG